MIDIDIKITGDLDGALDAMEARIRDQVLLSGVAVMAKVVYDEVKSNASQRTISGNKRPKDRPPGTLEGAIYRVYSPELSRNGVRVYKVSVNKKKAGHWALVEYGSSRAPAHPYIRPAAAKLPEAIAAGRARISELLEESRLAKGSL